MTRKTKETKPVPASFYDNSWWINSGDDADYAILKMDILNLAMTEKEYLNNVEVKVVFDDVYEYGGWTGQYNYSNATDDHSKYFGEATNKQNTEFIIDKADHFSIGPMYEGHYCFGCTLPNAVVSEGRALQSQLADYNCTTQRNVDALRFDMSNYSSAIQATDTANTQKILDAMSQNKIESLQAEVNALKTQNMFCGIPRINPYGYGVYAYPQANMCGCGGNI